MPIVRVSMASGRTAEQKKALAVDITEAMVRHCGGHADHVYVVFEDVHPDDWTVGGKTITERKQARGEA